MESPCTEKVDSKPPRSYARPSRATVFLVGLLLIVGLIVHWRRELILIVLHGMPDSTRESFRSRLIETALAIDGPGLWLAKIPVCRDPEIAGQFWESILGLKNLFEPIELNEAEGAELAAVLESGQEVAVNRVFVILSSIVLKSERQVERVVNSLPALFQSRDDARLLKLDSALIGDLLNRSKNFPEYANVPAQISENALHANSSELRRYIRGGARVEGCDLRDLNQVAIQRLNEFNAMLQSEIVQIQLREIEKRNRSRAAPIAGNDVDLGLEEGYRRLFSRLDLDTQLDTAFLIATRAMANLKEPANLSELLRPMVATIFESRDELRFDFALIISELCEGRSEDFISFPLIEQWLLHSLGSALYEPAPFLRTLQRLLHQLALADGIPESERKARLNGLYPKNEAFRIDLISPRRAWGYRVSEGR